MCNLQAGGQAVKHLSELLKCFVFIYKALNHKADPNKLNKSEWRREVYGACRTIKEKVGGVCRCPLACSSVPAVRVIRISAAVALGGFEMGPVLFPPAAQVWRALLLGSRLPCAGVDDLISLVTAVRFKVKDAKMFSVFIFIYFDVVWRG